MVRKVNTQQSKQQHRPERRKAPSYYRARGLEVPGAPATPVVARQQVANDVLATLVPHLYSAGGRGLARGPVGQVPPQVAMPVLGDHAAGTALVPAQQYLPVPAAAPQRGEALVKLSKLSWRYRFQLAPAVASLGVITAAGVTDPLAVGAGLAATAAGLPALPEEIRGRTWLSQRERKITAAWAGGAGLWALGMEAGLWHLGGWGLGALAVATTAQCVMWLRSRAIRSPEEAKEAKMSDKARQLLAAWPEHVATSQTSPEQLRGSLVVDIEEPAEGTVVCTIQLAPGKHAEHADIPEVRRWLEVAYGMGIGTARIEKVRENASQVRLVLTPSRQLETVSKLWDGPIVTEDGRTPIAVTTAGALAYIRLWDKSGVRHLVMVGSSGSGKTNTYNVMLLPGVLARKEVMIYVDGKRGTSSPELARAMDMVARKDADWGPAIEMVHAVMVAREDRYGEMGLSTFDVNGPDPILVLVIDEGHTVKKALTARQEEMVEEISERGRALGVALKIGVQRPSADHIPGGMATRDNLMGTAGNVVALRAGGAVSKGLALTSTSAEIDLLGLPEGPGWCAVLSGGGVVADQARILHIPPAAEHPERIDLLAKHLPADFVPRSLTGADAAAAGATYANRTTGADWLAGMAIARAKRAAENGEGELEDGTAGVRLDKPAGPTTPPPGVGLAVPAAARVVEQSATPVEGSTDALRAGAARFPRQQKALNATAKAAAARRATNKNTIVSVMLGMTVGQTKASIAQAANLAETTTRNAIAELEAEGRIYQDEAGLWHAVRAAEAA